MSPDFRKIVESGRSQFRVNEKLPISWRTTNNVIQGKGKIRNISIKGMLIETAQDVASANTADLAFESSFDESNNFIPTFGRLVWTRKKGPFSKKYLSGVEFAQPIEGTMSQLVMARLRDRVQEKVRAIARAQKTVNVVGDVLLIAMVVITAFVVYQQAMVYKDINTSHNMLLSVSERQAQVSRDYAQKYMETATKLMIVSTDLNALRSELDSTRVILAEAEQILGKTKGEIAALQQENIELQKFVQNLRGDFDSQVTTLKEKNEEFDLELSVLQEQMQYYEGNFESLEDGAAALAFFKKKLKLVHSKIAYLKKEARYTKIEAQKEADRIAMLTGNNGYFMKDGQYLYNGKELPAATGKVEIDVSIVE